MNTTIILLKNAKTKQLSKDDEKHRRRTRPHHNIIMINKKRNNTVTTWWRRVSVCTLILIGFCCSWSSAAGAAHASSLEEEEQNLMQQEQQKQQQQQAQPALSVGSMIGNKEYYADRSVKDSSSYIMDVTKAANRVMMTASSCLNNPDWTYNEAIGGSSIMNNGGSAKLTVDCWSLHQSSESQRVKYCQIEDVHLNCPVTCGVCCEDDLDSIFVRDNGMYGSCGWLSGKQDRMDRYCDAYNMEDQWVWSACPLTCNRCKSYVSLPPSQQPSTLPSTSSPTYSPSYQPSELPSRSATHSPSQQPSDLPSTSSPTYPPSYQPSVRPSQSQAPSNRPTAVPTMVPTTTPTAMPTVNPTARPSKMPSETPSTSPSVEPSQYPTLYPSVHPSLEPTLSPTSSPSHNPSITPTEYPSEEPSALPSKDPTDSPSNLPTDVPTMLPSTRPTMLPSMRPSVFPSKQPTVSPSDVPSTNPSDMPSSNPTTAPTEVPTSSPTSSIKPSPTPTTIPSASPTLAPTVTPSSSPSLPTPNLVMLLTDEQNFRTLSCYRDYLLSQYNMSHVDVWGDNLSVHTPNIDSLAKDGAMFTHFYTSSPLCTPSRGTFMTGMYPPFTGTATNTGVLDAELKTWAEILRDERGYKTSYMGKWHLDGDAKPGVGAPAGRDFGFDHNTYRYNRGHWKYFDEVNGSMEVYEISAEEKFAGRLNRHFSTDFLMDRGIEFIESAASEEKPFALVISFPDPHAPNKNRPFYRDMYTDLEFSVPETARKNLKYDPAPPAFNTMNFVDILPDNVDEYYNEFEQNFFTNHMQQYYGMAKCIDFNVGKLLNKLKALGIDDNTIIVYTSDHGGMKLEHGIMNKNYPYETSAGIPFLVKYPDRVPAGKIIDTAHSSVDFAPTILSMMGISQPPPDVNFQGVDASPELMNSDSSSNVDHITFSFETGNTPHWAAAIKKGYKLIFSYNDVPWLFDLNQDPDEMINFATSTWHQPIFEELRDALIGAFTRFEIPLGKLSNFLFLDVPACNDSLDVLPVQNGKTLFCKDIGINMPMTRCENQEKIREHCPVSCKACCQDSPGKMWVNNSVRTCDSLKDLCGNTKVQQFCPVTCNAC